MFHCGFANTTEKIIYQCGSKIQQKKNKNQQL